MKRLSFFCPRAGSTLTGFLEWLLRELTSDFAQSPSGLECVTLRLRIQYSVKEVGTAHARALSDVLADERHYPKIKEVKFAVIPECCMFVWTADEIGHKEKIEMEMHALQEKGVLQLQWVKG